MGGGLAPSTSACLEPLYAEAVAAAISANPL